MLIIVNVSGKLRITRSFFFSVSENVSGALAVGFDSTRTLDTQGNGSYWFDNFLNWRSAKC